MLLSNIFKEYGFLINIVINNEKSFDYLALTASNINGLLCVFLDDEKYINDISSNVRMVITNKRIGKLLEGTHYGICIVDNPREVFFLVHNYLSEKRCKSGKKEKTIVGKNCNISILSSIAKNNVRIGDNVVIEEFVVVRENTTIGDYSIIRAGSVVGGQGYEFKRVGEGILSVAHAGGVMIGNNVEIQHNTCIDRGVFDWDNTIIGDNCKIDNLVHIAHGVKIGRNSMIVANVGIGGRTIIGENTWIGFSATITNGVSVGDNSRANIGSVVTKSIPNGGSFTGNFAIDHSIFLKNLKKSLGND
ncbi:MAG TPA: UDP-3-O-(3-hydroxymyristoyl)glucosamine N-acyltransferase [Clostridiales bacterium]|mgnify:CR=1 FL=1|jgi:UDP-3-O-[3-hydroxymyristoyl] glucosamine N-acyltransferase|nr:UDP-3-O-(3-hydroxymyristoyl)glucosamine N-acyltransferase [Clostridiales bacterium]